MSISVFIVFGYVALMFVIAFILTKRSHTTSELFLAKRELGVLLLVPLLFGEIIAASSTTGTAQGGFSQGISAIWVFVGKGLGCVVFAFLLARFFDAAGKAGCMSVPEAFRWRFDTKMRYVVVIIILVPLVLLCSTQCRAVASLVSPMVGVNVDVLIVVAGLVFGLFALSGIRGMSKMNVVHSFMILFGLILAACVCVWKQGGLALVFDSVPVGHDELLYPSVWEIGGQFISATLAFCVAITPVNACYSSGNLKTSRTALIIAGVLSAVFAFFPTLVGMCGSIALPDADPNTILYTMPETISPLLSGLASMAVLAAVLSTAPFLFLSASTIFVRDILLPFRKEATERSAMRWTAVITGVMTVAVILLALDTQSIFGQIVGANHIKAMAAFVLLVGLAWKRMTNSAAFWALAISGALSMVWYFSGSVFGFDIEPLWPALAVSAVLMVVITLFDRRHWFADYERFKASRDQAMTQAKGSSAHEDRSTAGDAAASDG